MHGGVGSDDDTYSQVAEYTGQEYGAVDHSDRQYHLQTYQETVRLLALKKVLV